MWLTLDSWWLCQHARIKSKGISKTLSGKHGSTKKKMVCLCQRSRRVQRLFMPGGSHSNSLPLPFSPSSHIESLSLHLPLSFFYPFHSSFSNLSLLLLLLLIGPVGWKRLSVKAGGMSCPCIQSICVGREVGRDRVWRSQEDCPHLSLSGW